MSYKILIINPGSTSTKIGVFEDETLLFEETLWGLRWRCIPCSRTGQM